jgi:GT2 family glycosyltransferase
MLLYEDDSLQHAGLYFDRPPGAHVWANEHYFKGLHRTLPAANRSRPVAAVTAACMLIDADLYQRFGGLRGSYVQGDYEDSDLCLRLADAGYENWYFAGTALYHLEGQSYPSAERTLASEYNKWLHTYTWRSRLAAMESAAGA